MLKNKKMMRIINKTVIFFLLFILVLSMAACEAPPRYIKVEINGMLTGMPKNAVFADMLVKINPDCLEYIDFNSANGEKFGITEDSPIATYNEDGFMSFTFHFMDAASDMTLEKRLNGDDSATKYFYLTFADTGLDDTQFRNILNNYHIIKIALLDEHGNILQISNEVDIKPPERWSYFNFVVYNAKNGTLEAVMGKTSPSDALWVFPLLILVYIVAHLSVIIGIPLSIMIKTVLAIPFKIEPKWKILCVNIVTQIIIVVFMALSNPPYIQALAIIEALVCFSEFGVYTILFKDTSKLKLVLYTVAANTASLVIGILFNTYRALFSL